MADNAQKTPFVKALNEFTEGVTGSAQQLIGKSMPAQVVSVDSTGTIVTVKFLIDSIYTLPSVTCAVGYPPFIRFPMVPGTLGVVTAIDYYIGGVTGLGGGVASLTQQANLATLVFFATGNANLPPTDNDRASVLYGPDGTILRDFGNNGPGRNGSNVSITIDGDGNVQIYGAKSVSTDVHGYGERLTYDGGDQFTHEVWHTGATIIEVTHDFHPPQIPPP